MRIVAKIEVTGKGEVVVEAHGYDGCAGECYAIRSSRAEFSARREQQLVNAMSVAASEAVRLAEQE